MPVFSVTALLFDCDGVLVDSLGAAAVAWNEWGTRWKPGFNFHRDVEHGRRLSDFVAELVGPEDAAEATAELAALERDHAVDVHEIPGAAALLANLPAGRWAVVTSGTRDIATARLIAAGIPTPAVLVTADDVAKGKPSPDPYLLAAHQLDLPPSDCAVFEDAAAGVTSAQRAGVRTIIAVGTDVTMPGTSAAVPDLRGITFDGARLFVGESAESPPDQT